MNQLNIFGKTESETSPGLAKLWKVIGEAGSRLELHERASVVAGLNFHAAYGGDTSLYVSFPGGLTIGDCELSDPYAALEDIYLSPGEAWQAIAQIALRAQILESQDAYRTPAKTNMTLSA